LKNQLLEENPIAAGVSQINWTAAVVNVFTPSCIMAIILVSQSW